MDKYFPNENCFSDKKPKFTKIVILNKVKNNLNNSSITKVSDASIDLSYDYFQERLLLKEKLNGICLEKKKLYEMKKKALEIKQKALTSIEDTLYYNSNVKASIGKKDLDKFSFAKRDITNQKKDFQVFSNINKMLIGKESNSKSVFDCVELSDKYEVKKSNDKLNNSNLDLLEQSLKNIPSRIVFYSGNSPFINKIKNCLPSKNSCQNIFNSNIISNPNKSHYNTLNTNNHVKHSNQLNSIEDVSSQNDDSFKKSIFPKIEGIIYHI